jgi:hypothetical protein
LRARRTAPWAWLLAAILVLPRLVGGAHWLTDILIGSGSMALVSISLLMATPVHDVFLKMLCGDFFEIREPNPHGEAAARTPSTNESEPLRRAA